MTYSIIDTHIHVWDPGRVDYPWLNGDHSILNDVWSLEQIEKERKDNGISAGVLVQASGNKADTAWMMAAAEENNWIKGIVGWLPLKNPDNTNDELENYFLPQEILKGVRHQIHDEKDPQWLLQPAVLESLSILASKNIPFDLVCVIPEHIRTALKVAEKIPELRMVFDHLSQPPIASGEQFGEWGALMQSAAKHQNFYAKISGLGTASGNFINRTAEDITPYIDFVLKHFGTNRCFCGSDWPVSMLHKSYTHTWEIYKTILEKILTGNILEQVYFDNANDFYQLNLSKSHPCN